VAKEEYVRYEYIYKEGYPLIDKRWDEEGKIMWIDDAKRFYEERIHLTDDMIEEYSTERYRNVLKLKKIKE
jgi:hypothetical protein